MSVKKHPEEPWTRLVQPCLHSTLALASAAFGIMIREGECHGSVSILKCQRSLPTTAPYTRQCDRYRLTSWYCQLFSSVYDSGSIGKPIYPSVHWQLK